MLQGVIFDFDGVLVDSESAHLEAFRKVLALEIGVEVTVEEYESHYLGLDDHTCVLRALERRGLPTSSHTIRRLVDLKWQAYAENLGHVRSFPGAETLVRALHAAEVPLAIASGSRRAEIEAILRSRDLLGHFRGIVSSGDVSNFKPHPEPYLRGRGLVDAAESPEGVLAIEDSTAGIASARAAGLRVIGVTNSHPRAKLALAHHILDSLEGVTLDDVERFAIRG